MSRVNHSYETVGGGVVCVAKTALLVRYFGKQQFSVLCM